MGRSTTSESLKTARKWPLIDVYVLFGVISTVKIFDFQLDFGDAEFDLSSDESLI